MIAGQGGRGREGPGPLNWRQAKKVAHPMTICEAPPPREVTFLVVGVVPLVPEDLLGHETS